MIFLTGCASLWDAPQNVLGFSRRDMDAARGSAASAVYHADFLDVYEAILDIATKSKYHVFLKDEVRGFIVLMDVPGMVDTTEVGVYVTSLAGGGRVRVEVSSRSTPAKRVVAERILNALAESFQAI